MRILTTITILLFTIHAIKSSEDAGFTIKEVSNEIKNVPQFAENSFLEHELLNGKMTPIDLMEKVLGRKVDQNELDEYSKMDISNGIKEQNELMDLFEKAKNSETSDKDKKDIGDGIDQMEGMNVLKLINEEVKKIPEKISKEIKMIESMINLNIDFKKDEFRYNIITVSYRLRTFSKRVDEVRNYGRELPDEFSKDYFWIVDTLNKISTDISLFCESSKKLQNQLRKMEEWDKIPNIKSIRDSIDSIKKLKDRIEKMKNLDGLGSKLFMMENEMKVLEQLRDSQTIPEIPKFIKKLENDYNSIERFRPSEETFHKFEKVETASKFLQKVENYASYIKKLDSSVPGIMNKWKSLGKFFKNLKIPTGSLSEKFAGFKTCLEQYDFSIDFSNDLIELDKIDKKLEGAINEIRNSSVRHMFNNLLGVREFEKYVGILESRRSVHEVGLKEVLKKTVWSFDLWGAWEAAKDFEYKIDDPERPGHQISKFEELLRGLQKSAEIDYDHIQSVTNGIKAKSAEVLQLLKCYSDLNVLPSEVKSLMDEPKKVWNFDPNQMETTVEAIDSLKEANEIMNELKNWKFDNNPLFDEFPLNSEDVQGILNGFELLKSIQNIQNNWIKMTNLDYLQIEKSDIKNEWNEMMTSLGSFIEQLSQMETHLKLSDIQLLISQIQFPSDIQIDLIIDFMNKKYQGNDRNGILNILEDVKYLQNDFSSYSTKLQKMNESIEKLKKWMKEPVDKDEELKTDCFENSSCSDLVTLPEAIP